MGGDEVEEEAKKRDGLKVDRYGSERGGGAGVNSQKTQKSQTIFRT